MGKFLILLLSLLLSPLMAADPGVYVWNRQHDEDLKKSVTSYYKKCSGKIYYLAGELENDGGTIRIALPPFADPVRSVPVVRIHIAHMKKTVSALAVEIAELYKPWSACGELQIDLDAPESKISYYKDLMLELRKCLPGVKLSATVLPCHLRHTAVFRTLAKACDYYVLQVHGLTKNKDNSWFILDETIARTALFRADLLHLPYKVALPLYSNVVEHGKVVKPDLTLVADLAHGREVIGFRLGAAGDMDVLDLESALTLCRGKCYTPSLLLRWEEQEGGAWHLFIGNKGFFPENIALEFTWHKDLVMMDQDTFNGAEWSPDRKTLRLLLPPAGTEKPYLWIRCKGIDPAKTPPLTVKIKE